jgi:hypothetical protein
MIEEILGTAHLGNHRALHIAPLSRETITGCGAEHLGFGGYFLFETNDEVGRKGINVLAKTASLDAAFILLEIWRRSTVPVSASQV